VAVTLGAALVFGVLPAWQGTQADAGESLKHQGRGGMRSAAQMRTGRLLVSLQLALSLPLLVGRACSRGRSTTCNARISAFPRSACSSCASTCRTRSRTARSAKA
jgi:hypothetical protein